MTDTPEFLAARAKITDLGFGVLIDAHTIRPRVRVTVYPGPRQPISVDGADVFAALLAAHKAVGDAA